MPLHGIETILSLSVCPIKNEFRIWHIYNFQPTVDGEHSLQFHKINSEIQSVIQRQLYSQKQMRWPALKRI